MKIKDLIKKMKDNTVEEYHVMFKLSNKENISTITTIDEFKGIVEWYKNKDEESYLIAHDNIYSYINKKDIVEFSYIEITKGNNIYDTVKYLFEVPTKMDIWNYLKFWLVTVIGALICYVLYHTYTTSDSITMILNNTSKINTVIRETTTIGAILIVGCLIIHILQLMVKVTEDKKIIYDLRQVNKNSILSSIGMNYILIFIFILFISNMKMF